MTTHYHTHHIVPKHAGGTDDPSNLVKVTVEEHAELHFARYLEYGEMGDWMAYHALSGQIEHQDLIYFKAQLGGHSTTSKHSDKLASWGRKGGQSKSVRKLESIKVNLDPAKKEKPVILTDAQGNEHYFPTVNEAAFKMNLHRPNLSGVLTGNRKTVGGYTARYAN